MCTKSEPNDATKRRQGKRTISHEQQKSRIYCNLDVKISSSANQMPLPCCIFCHFQHFYSKSVHSSLVVTVCECTFSFIKKPLREQPWSFTPCSGFFISPTDLSADRSEIENRWTLVHVHPFRHYSLSKPKFVSDLSRSRGCLGVGSIDSPLANALSKS